ASQNLIGGPAGRNVISANGGSGVQVQGARAVGNVLIGNYLGSDATGTVAVGNGLHGIFVNGAPSTIIGAAAPAYGNLISGNVQDGIYIANLGLGLPVDSSGFLTIVQGNRIGTDAGGSRRLSNG